MYAQELSGTHVGGRIGWWLSNSRTGYTVYREIHPDDTITMLTHKKNGNVKIRAGKRGREYELVSTCEVEVLTPQP